MLSITLMPSLRHIGTKGKRREERRSGPTKQRSINSKGLSLKIFLLILTYKKKTRMMNEVIATP